MRIVIAGGSGFVGEPLVRHLQSRGHSVSVLSRNPAKVRAGVAVRWDSASSTPWSAEVQSADAVVNLAGENISEGRWTSARQRALVDSRVETTRRLVAAIRGAAKPPALVNASAVGYYGFNEVGPLDESSPKGEGFLADLAAAWEAAALEASSVTRVAILRFGVILAPDGGALAKLLVPFRLGAGGPIASGQQWMSWISRDDVIRMIEWAISTPAADGVYNATAPEPVTNAEFTRALGQAVRRPALVPVPAFALRALFGEMADEALIGGQRVRPGRALEQGFSFAHPSLDAAFAAILPRA